LTESFDLIFLATSAKSITLDRNERFVIMNRRTKPLRGRNKGWYEAFFLIDIRSI